MSIFWSGIHYQNLYASLTAIPETLPLNTKHFPGGNSNPHYKL